MELMKSGNIQCQIFLFRDLPVNKDRDLVELYQVDAKVLNQAVKRNIDRFPENYRFPLSNEEKKNWSHIVTGLKSSGKELQGRLVDRSGQ